MIELSSGSGLLLEAAQAVSLTGHGRGEDPDGHVAPEPGVAGAVDLAMPPAPRGATTSYGPSRVPAARAIAPPA